MFMGQSLILEKLNMVGLRCLSRNTIKWIAMIAMICDHIAYQFCEEGSVCYIICRMIIGRIAFPMFVALFVDGYFRTKHPVRHLAVLFFFAVVSEPFFDILFGVHEQSVMWTWAFGWLMFLIFDKLDSSFASDPDLRKQFSDTALYIVEIGIMILFAIVATILNFDYIFVGICSMGFGYFVWKDVKQNGVLIVGIIAALIDGMCFRTYGVFLAVPVLFLYDKEHKCRYHKRLKYLFYILYPLHLGMIALFAIICQM